MVRQAKRVSSVLSQQSGELPQRFLKEVQQVLPLVERVITQTRSQVLQGKKVASDEKVLSLFEPHTRAIPRHKGGALVEVGRQVILDETEDGIVTRYQILQHPNEHGQAISAVQHQGRIASLRRDYGWRECEYHGQDGMERWLGLGVIASNLRRIALAKKA
jgi:transposase, IS5 family